MSYDTNLLATARDTLIELVHPQKKIEQEQAQPDAPARTEVEQRERNKKTILVFALVFFLFVLVKNAWLSDDSFITLRTVYNFVHGYGLTWNIDERVQAFTHPLWMFLLSGSYFFVRSIYFSSLLLSLTVSMLVVSLFVFRLAPSTLAAVVGLTILAASKSFIDFSTSGLENPLTHLLIVLFAIVFFQCQQSKRYLLWLSLLGSMMILNRMDTALLFLPALVYAWYRSKPRLKSLRTVLLAFIPFIAWEIFSLFYYGFLFPNTAYAKLNTGISTGQLMKQGIVYLIGSSTFDPLLFFVIISAILLVIILHDWKSIPLLLGMMLYIAYVVRIGGDFMVGRFLTPPFLMAVILLIRNIPSSSKLMYAGIFLAVVLFGFLAPNSRWYVVNPSTEFTDLTAPSGLLDEHNYYASASGLLNFVRNVVMPNSPLTQAGLQAQQNHTRVVVFRSIGYFGYAAGPSVHVVDDLALADPLLARLPLTQAEENTWRIGHFARDIPPGYLDTLETGTNKIQDPGLAQYYARLHDVVSGPLFSWQRLQEIWGFNTGAYNSLLQHYIQSLLPKSSVPGHPPLSPHNQLLARVEKRAAYPMNRR